MRAASFPSGAELFDALVQIRVHYLRVFFHAHWNYGDLIRYNLRAVMSTSKLSVAIRPRASVTLEAAITSNPLRSSAWLIMARTALSSSTSKTLCAAFGSVGVMEHRLLTPTLPAWTSTSFQTVQF